ncbi:MAG: hypothetical protein QM758_29590 [Armatimonas sp.]
MRVQQEKRPLEFLAALRTVPARARIVKRLTAYGTNSNGLKLRLGYVAPKSVVLRGTDPMGKEVLYYQTDGRTTLYRESGKPPVRGKFGPLPAGMPKLVSFLLGEYSLTDYGLPGTEDAPRQYTVSKKNWEKRPVTQLTYKGSDSIGRGQEGELLIDQQSGLPVSFDERQLGNSPRDDGDYAVWEHWPTLQAK